MDDMEDRNWCNNVWLCAIPEATGQEDNLEATVQAILNCILGDPGGPQLEFDWDHRP